VWSDWIVPLLLGFVFVTAAWDLRRRELPHRLTYGAVGAFLLLHALSGSFWLSLIGALGMGLITVVPVITGRMGGADLPLFMALGAALGVLWAAVAVLITVVLVRVLGRRVAAWSGRYRPNPRHLVPVAPLAALAVVLVTAGLLGMGVLR